MSEEEIRLDQTKKVFDTIATLIKKNETCSYRYLIYDLLGFKGKDYATLLNGMELTNKLVECETQKEVLDKIKEYIKENACYDKDIKQCCRDLLTDECDYVLKLLEEIE